MCGANPAIAPLLQLCWERPGPQLQPLFFVAKHERKSTTWSILKISPNTETNLAFLLVGNVQKATLSQSSSGSREPQFNYSGQGHSQFPVGPPSRWGQQVLSVPQALHCPGTATLPRVVGCKWTEWLGIKRCVKWLLTVDTPPWCFLVNVAFTHDKARRTLLKK